MSSSTSSLSREELVDKIKGCIYGNALGDAFGLSTEFMSKEHARHYYGVGPIKFGKASGFEFRRDVHRSRWQEGDFTDDTDQMLLILQSILETNLIVSPKHFAFRLKEWSSIGFPELKKRACGIGFTVGSTFSHNEFLENPHKASYDVWNSNERNLAANGAVMRTSVLGVPFYEDEGIVVKNAINIAKVTHADPRSVVSAVIVSVIISRLLKGESSYTSSFKDEEIKKKHAEYEKLLLHGCSGNSEELYSSIVETQPKPKHLVSQRQKRKSLLERLTNFFGTPDFQEDYRLTLPTIDAEREKTPAYIPQILPPSIDTFGNDEALNALSKNVVEEYQFLLQGNPLCPSKDGESGSGVENSWTNDLHKYCFPNSLSSLELSEPKSIGYTLKCLGSGIYCFSRAIPKDMSASDFFKAAITQLTLEGGDSDTNCAVAGALLGCRLGKSNLPKEWLKGLRNTDFLENIADQLCGMVLDQVYVKDGGAKLD